MRVFRTGVGCVGKTTIGLRLAELMGLIFFDVDTEIEQFFEMSIEQLHQKYWMPHDFRKETSKALSIILDKPESQQAVRHRLAAKRTDGRLSGRHQENPGTEGRIADFKATGTFSSRKLEKATYDSIAYRYICANTHPDHDSTAPRSASVS